MSVWSGGSTGPYGRSAAPLTQEHLLSGRESPQGLYIHQDPGHAHGWELCAGWWWPGCSLASVGGRHD